MARRLISTRKRGLVLMAIMMAISICVAVIANIILYNSYLSYQKTLLGDMLHFQRSWIRNLNETHKTNNSGSEGQEKLEFLKIIQKAQSEFHGFGETGEFLVSAQIKDSIFYLIFSHKISSGQLESIPLARAQNLPLYLALKNPEGALANQWDYSGDRVLAATTPISELNLGLTAKMDMRELREPFYKASWLNAMVVFFVIVVGLDLFRRVGKPMVLYEDEREEKYQNLFESSQLGIMVLGDKLEECNEKFTRLWGSSKEKLIGLSSQELFSQHPQPNSDWSGRLEEAINMAFNRQESKLLWKIQGEKERYCEISLKPIEYHNQKFLLGSVEDITSRIEGEHIQAKLEAQLRQAQKMEATGRLAGGIAHDYNNILATITLNADFLGENLSKDSDSQEEVRLIKEAAQRGKKLTQQLLAFSRRKPVTLEMLDLNQVVSNLLEMIQRLMEKHIHLEMKLSSHSCYVYADKTSVEQVIMNLVINSKDAIEGEGNILISTEKVHLRSSDIQNSSQEIPGQYVVLSVEDTGQGMTAETLGQIFEPFFTTKDIGKGTGLGLSTVYGIVKQMDGFIRVDSKLNKGSKFQIFFPDKPKKS